MRLTFIIVLIGLLEVSANVYSQQTKLSMTLNNVTLEDAFRKIEDSSNFVFFYNAEQVQLDQRVSLSAENESIEAIMANLLKDKAIDFKVTDRRIVLYPKNDANSLLSQQAVQVKGKVIDGSGAPLPGVSIVIKGTTTGVISDVNGNYTLPNVPGSATLVYSFVGMRSQEIVVGGKTMINVTLAEDAVAIEEIVAVGYGTQKKGNLTGAIATVKSDDLVKVSNNDVTNTLTGRAPGVRIVQMSSEPGKYDSQIDIRGFSYTRPTDNINGDQTGGPLFIVDGVQRDKSGFDRLDPNEIESVSILKDASAAIYGVKAANGVILVTTKQGKQGKLKVGYTGQTGIQFITKYPELCNAYQYATLYDEMQVNGQISGRAEFTQTKFTAAQIEAFRTGEVPSTDWLSLIMGNNATQQQHNLTLNGGSDKIRYFASAGYFDETGLYKTDISWGKKYNFRINVRAELAKGLDAGVNIGLINTISNAPRTDAWALLSTTWKLDPTEPVYANDDVKHLNQFQSGDNHPLALISQDINGYQHKDQKFLTSTFDLKYNIPFIKGLSAKALFAYDINYSDNKSFNKKYNTYDYLFDADNVGYYKAFAHASPSSLSEYFGQGKKKDTQLSLNYANSFGKHNVSGLVLYEQIEWINNSFDGSTEFVIDAVDHLFAGVAAKDATNSGYSESANRSLVGRFTYDYDGKYLAEFGFREDGSSRFPSNSRWGFFPYGSAGWRISEEPFIKDNLPFITNLKVRGSYGKEGDDAAADFQFLTGYTYPSGGYQFATTWTSGLGFKNSANPNITWYTSTQTDLGLEGSLWRGLLSFEFDVFRREREGLLAYRNTTIPATYGVNLPQENLEGDRTQGYELVFGHRNQVNELTYSVSANVTYARTQNRYKEETPASNDYDYWRNRYTNRYNDVVWGYKTDGQFQSFEEIRTAPIIDGAGNRTILPGDVKYVDVNGDGFITSQDETVIGRGQSKPCIYFGADISLAWKNLDFSVLLQGATMYQVLYQDQLSRPFYWGTANPITEFWDRWHREDVLDPNSKWIPGKNPSTGERQNYKTSEFWLRDASYLRVKSIEIGYTLPKRITSKYSIDQLRIFANGYNVYTFAKGLDFVDPEYTDDRLYSYNYPITMNVNFGVQLNF